MNGIIKEEDGVYLCYLWIGSQKKQCGNFTSLTVPIINSNIYANTDSRRNLI